MQNIHLEKNRNKHALIRNHPLQLLPLSYGLFHGQMDGLKFTKGGVYSLVIESRQRVSLHGKVLGNQSKPVSLKAGKISVDFTPQRQFSPESLLLKSPR